MERTIPQPWLIVRIVVDGFTRVVEHVDKETDVEAIADKHRAYVETAAAAGRSWLVEVVDPNGDIPPVQITNDPNYAFLVIDSPEALERWLDSLP